MSKFLFEDRRGGSDRRTGRERRSILKDHNYLGIERRRCMERRSGGERRRWFRLFVKLGCRPLYPLSAHEKITGKQFILH